MKKESLKQGILFLLNKSKFSRLITGAAILLSIISTICSLAIPLIIRNVIDSFSYADIKRNDFILFGVLLILQLLFSYVSSLILAFQGEKIVADTRCLIWNKLLKLKIGYFQKMSPGEMTSYLISDSVSIKNLVTVQIPTFLNSCIVLVVPLIALVTIPIGKRLSSLSRKNQDELAKLTGFSNQILGEIKLVKSTNSEGFEVDRGNQKIANLFNSGFAVSKLQSIVTPIVLLLLMISFSGVLAFGQYRVAQEALTSGTLMAFLLYMFQLINPLSNMASFFNAVQTTNGAVQRILEILNYEVEEYEEDSMLSTLNIESLTFSNVTFKYQNDSDPVLSKISFQAKKGQKIAIVGPSGAGKTTILSLIERFYLPESGRIFTQEGDINAVSLQTWRNNISYVSQDTPVVSGTLYENLTYGIGREITTEECREALKLTNLSTMLSDNIYDLQKEIDERGKNLSGGEKQRVAIARTFLKGAPILIFDEATANLDADSEKVIQNAIKRISKDKITIIIAHRLSTIVDSDEIIFIEEGRVTGTGKHFDLMESHNVYKRYVDNQFLVRAASDA